ncbi:MAG: CPBP family intramembrane metalloprotease [Burkholderiales bacterium]|nr:CPBP family intramembrane metalloprotease [Burkholderiales bacterium]
MQDLTPFAGYNPAMRNADFLPLHTSPRPWGLVATFGLSLAIWYTLELLQAAMGTGMEAVLHDFKLVPAAANTQALHFAIITCISTVLCGALVIAAAGLRDSLDPRAYLGLHWVSARELLRWVLVTLVIVAQTDLVLYLVKGELLPVQWVEIYRSVHSPLLFWIALVVATPIFEELLYRGFVFEGIRASRLGGLGAVLITALIWTLIHQEYDPLEFAMIFIVGLMLGIARLRTGSVLLTIVMHMLHNLIGSGEIAWLALMGE